MDKICRVYLARFAEKQFQKLPHHIQVAYFGWARSVEHDELLSGSRKGQRSVRLNRSYRVIYEEDEMGDVILIAVQEVNKHDY